VVGPRDGCREAATKLSVKHIEGNSRSLLRWDWKDGGTVHAFEVAHPDVDSAVSICLFDESAAEPALLYSDGIGDEVPEPEGWSVDGAGGMHFRSRTDAISAIDLRVGDSAKLGLKSGAPDLPTPALPFPLRAQLQVSGGACFEGTYGLDEIRRNANGVFKARTDH
jgi:hypothetical protein